MSPSSEGFNPVLFRKWVDAGMPDEFEWQGQKTDVQSILSQDVPSNVANEPIGKSEAEKIQQYLSQHEIQTRDQGYEQFSKIVNDAARGEKSLPLGDTVHGLRMALGVSGS